MVSRILSQGLPEIIGYFPVTGIIGPRQVGKTTLCKSLVEIIRKEVVYLDLENPRDLARLTDPVLFFERNLYKCVILDEIQRRKDLFPVLRAMVDKNRVPARFVILGSASPDLIRDSSESLAGRIAYNELTPFNILEVKNIEGYIFENHWLKGGFPDAYLAPTQDLTFLWFDNFIKTYIERDLPLLGLSADISIIRRLWTMAAHMHGSLLNLESLSRSLQLSANTIKRYISFMENAFLIRQLRPFSINIKKRLVKSPKIYVRDSGILHHLLSIGSWDDLLSYPLFGNSWEGYVIEQICQLLSKKYEAYFYRTHEGAECDLLLTKTGKPEIGIEIKYSSSPKISRGMKQSFSDLQTQLNYIIIPETDEYMISENIRVCSLVTFIEKYLPGN